MPDPGRTTEPRNVTINTTNASAAITAAAGALDPVGDVGRTVTGAGIPGGTTIATVAANGAAGTLSANATATGSPSVALGAADPTKAGFRGWSPETAQEAGVFTVAAKNAGAVDHTRPASGARLNLQRSRL